MSIDIMQLIEENNCCYFNELSNKRPSKLQSILYSPNRLNLKKLLKIQYY